MNLLVTGAWQQAKKHIPELEAMGHTVVFLQQESDELPIDPAWVEGVVCNGLFLHHPMEQFTNLRYIQLTSAGYDRVPMDYVHKRGIQIHNACGVYSIPMAEFVLAGVLSIYKRLGNFRDQQRRHEWSKLRDLQELVGKRVLIVGCGSVGTECAKRFAAFDCEVVGIDKTDEPREHFARVLPVSQLDTELAQADVVVVTLPHTPHTHKLVHARGLKPDAVLVNVSRGATVDLTGVNAAVLDVFDEEPLLASSPLWDCNNIVLTPHNSFVGEGNTERLRNVILNNLRGGHHE